MTSTSTLQVYFMLANNRSLVTVKFTSIFGPFLSTEWNLLRLGGPTHGIVTKTVHKTLPG